VPVLRATIFTVSALPLSDTVVITSVCDGQWPSKLPGWNVACASPPSGMTFVLIEWDGCFSSKPPAATAPATP